MTLFEICKSSQSNISKKRLHLGGLAQSEWTRFVRAIRDTPVADDSAPGINRTRRTAYRPPITLSPFLLVLSVSYSEQSLWRCGQLWPYVGLGLLGVHLHQDCNAMGHTAKISPCVPSACAQSAILCLLIIHSIPSCQIYVAIDNPLLVSSISWLTTSSYFWNYVCPADIVLHAENLQSNGCQCVAHLDKFQDGIQVTRVCRYCGERQG